MIHGILCVQFTCLTVLFDNLCPGPLWSSSWSWTLYFMHYAFLHPVVIFFLQHMPVPTQPVLLQYQYYVIYSTPSLSLSSLFGNLSSVQPSSHNHNNPFLGSPVVNEETMRPSLWWTLWAPFSALTLLVGWREGCVQSSLLEQVEEECWEGLADQGLPGIRLFETWHCFWYVRLSSSAACCMEVRPGLYGKKMWWHFSEQRWEWSGGCVALS